MSESANDRPIVLAQIARERAQQHMREHGDLDIMLCSFMIPHDDGEGVATVGFQLGDRDHKDSVARIIRGIADRCGVNEIAMAISAWMAAVTTDEEHAQAERDGVSSLKKRQEILMAQGDVRGDRCVVLMDHIERDPNGDDAKMRFHLASSDVGTFEGRFFNLLGGDAPELSKQESEAADQVARDIVKAHSNSKPPH